MSDFLNPALDVERYAASLADHGRVRVDDILLPEVAARLHAQMNEEIPWDLSVTTPQGPAAVDKQQLEAAPADQRQALEQGILEQAKRTFSYCYGRYELIPGEPELLLEAAEFLASPQFIEFMRRLTGDDSLVRADAHATLYKPGYFLKKHDDTYSGKLRKYAFVFGLTPQWQADWGGLLCFQDERGNVTDVFLPRFNSMSLFKVPQDHFVSLVANYATANRYSITGWVFADDPA